MAEEAITEERNIWLRAFYGFDPANWGYLGFAHEKWRDDMLARMDDNDLVLIYGAVDDLTDRDLQAQALGFLEIRLEPCMDVDRISPDRFAQKKQDGFEDRWRFGIKVRRAWRVRNRVHIRTIAPEAYAQEHRFERTTRAIQLTPSERERALSHPVVQVNVFGEPPIDTEDLSQGQMAKILEPSRGIPPTFGKRETVIEDGETELYLMMFSEPAAFVLGDLADHAGQMLVKVGRSNDPKRRLGELNSGFPETAVFGWKLVQTLKAPNAAAAHEWEDELKRNFAAKFSSQGGEFFTGRIIDIKSAFHEFCIRYTPRIRGAAGTAKGVRR